MRAIAASMIVLLAGCAGAPESSLEGAEEPASAQAATSEETFDHKGTIAFSQCVHELPPGYMICFVNGASGPASLQRAPDQYVSGTAGPAVASGSATLTWSATQTGSDVLRIVAYTYDGCPDRCNPTAVVATVEGTSPLSVDVNAVSLAADQHIGFFVRAASVAGPAIDVELSNNQPFDLTGTLRFAL